MNKKLTKEILIYAFLYVGAITAANLTATNILSLPFVSFSLGTVFFGFVFTLRDKLHAGGRVAVYTALTLAAMLNLFLAIGQQVSMQIILASTIALIIGEITDTEVFAAVKKRWFVKSAVSNTVSVVVDSLLFNFLAFWGTELQSQIVALTFGDVILKYIFSGILILVFVFKFKKD